ncbi:MAG: SUMF1/EgtB/PvdO family nonheme iron enzyme [Verrucomicrobiota bacterium]
MKPLRSFVCLLLLLFVILFQCLTGHAAERVALVIGNGAYQIKPLPNPPNDAEAVAEMLRGGGYEVTELRDATAAEMGVALRQFAAKGAESEAAVFYFAGHGFEVGGANYLAPVDVELAIDDGLNEEELAAALDYALERETLPLREVLGQLRAKVPGLKVVVLDCCRDNPFQRERSWARTRSGGGGLARIDEKALPEGTMLVYAGEPGMAVPDGRGNHSPFTAALLGQLGETGGAGMLSVFTAVADRVGGSRRPWIKFDGTVRSLSAFQRVPMLEGGAKPGVGEAAELAELRLRIAEMEAREAERVETMARTEPEVEGGFGADRGMEGTRAGEVRSFGGIEMVWCPPTGEEGFMMGSPEDEEGRRDNELQHRVVLTKGFWLAKTECTQGQWESVMESNPSHFKRSENLPVEQVSWEDVQGWLMEMNGEHPLPEGWEWVLPSEAQWEYGCRAGTTTAFAFGDSLSSEQANFDGRSPYGGAAEAPYLGKTAEVGSHERNRWGLNDMHGNVYEWCSDWYGEYEGVTERDPAGAKDGAYRVLRGGGWLSYARGCRAANRGGRRPEGRSSNAGFRSAVSSIK